MSLNDRQQPHIWRSCKSATAYFYASASEFCDFAKQPVFIGDTCTATKHFSWCTRWHVIRGTAHCFSALGNLEKLVGAVKVEKPVTSLSVTVSYLLIKCTWMSSWKRHVLDHVIALLTRLSASRTKARAEICQRKRAQGCINPKDRICM